MSERTLADFWRECHNDKGPAPAASQTAAAPDGIADMEPHAAPPLAPIEPLAGMCLRLDRTCDRCRGCHPQCVGAVGPGAGPHSHGLRCTVCGLHRGWLPHRAADLLQRLYAQRALSPLPTLRDRGIVP